jgi:hypothetical protein
LLDWMEDHRESLNKVAEWTRKCKTEAFGDNDRVAAQRIQFKHANMKKIYNKLRREYEGKTGFGITENDCDSTIAGRFA